MLAPSQISLIDYLYLPCLIVRRLFQDGWGEPSVLEKIEMPQKIPLHAIPSPDIEFTDCVKTDEYTIKNGVFQSPCTLPGIPNEVRRAYFQWITPNNSCPTHTPTVLQFPATGDYSFYLRRNLIAKPLLKHGIGSLILQCPFYGSRKPDYQNGTEIRSVKDLLLLGAISVEEGRSILKWLWDSGYRTLGVTGVSRGALIASIVSAITPLPLAAALNIPAHSAKNVFTDRLTSWSCDWDTLRQQLLQSQKHRNTCPKSYLNQVFDVTSITRFPIPERPEAAICVSAANDGIVTPDCSSIFQNYWRGSELRVLFSGHVGSICFHIGEFNRAVSDSFKKLYA